MSYNELLCFKLFIAISNGPVHVCKIIFAKKQTNKQQKKTTSITQGAVCDTPHTIATSSYHTNRSVSKLNPEAIPGTVTLVFGYSSTVLFITYNYTFYGKAC